MPMAATATASALVVTRTQARLVPQLAVVCTITAARSTTRQTPVSLLSSLSDSPVLTLCVDAAGGGGVSETGDATGGRA